MDFPARAAPPTAAKYSRRRRRSSKRRGSGIFFLLSTLSLCLCPIGLSTSWTDERSEYHLGWLGHGWHHDVLQHFSSQGDVHKATFRTETVVGNILFIFPTIIGESATATLPHLQSPDEGSHRFNAWRCLPIARVVPPHWPANENDCRKHSFSQTLWLAQTVTVFEPQLSRYFTSLTDRLPRLFPFINTGRSPIKTLKLKPTIALRRSRYV
jgi:hypothetical protein